MWDAISSGNFPEWDLCLQLFTEEEANGFDFDVLDPTKLIPEELVPLKKVGRMVLDRMPDNFFAETEQVAFCPANIVPGIDFSNDPLLQGRLFSYLDTQLSRLGAPTSSRSPSTRRSARCTTSARRHMQTAVPQGRIAYEPNSLAPDGARESSERGFRTYPRSEGGGALRVRPASFADHYSQARLFYVSQTEPEQNHIVAALVFELSKVEAPAIRERMVGNLVNVDTGLAARVAAGLGLPKVPAASPTTVPAKRNPTPSPALSIHLKAKPTIEGRAVGCIVTDGVDGAIFDALKKAVTAAGAKLVVIAPRSAA